jgi:hypothetical protein
MDERDVMGDQSSSSIDVEELANPHRNLLAEGFVEVCLVDERLVRFVLEHGP